MTRPIFTTRFRQLAGLFLLALALVGAGSTTVARVLSFTDGTLTLGAKPSTGQSLCLTGGLVTGCTTGGAPTGAASGDLSGTYPGPGVAKVAGVTPGTGGLAVLDDASTSAIRTTLALVPGTDVQAYDADLTTWAGLTPSAYFQTLVDDGTAATARATLGAGQVPISSASAPGVGDDSADGYAVGQTWIETTTKTAYILTDASVGAAVWRAVLSGRRVHAYVSGGAALAVLQGWSGTAWVNMGTPVAPDATQSDAGATVALSGTGIVGAAGYAAFDKMSTAWRIWWYLDGTGGLGLTWTPASAGGVARLVYDGDQPTTASYQAGAWLGHKTTPATWGIYSSYGKGSASFFYWYTTDDDAVGTSGGACTRAGPAEAGLVYDTAPVSIGWGYGRAAAGFVSDSGGPIGASLATPAFGFAAVRPGTGGAALTVANMVADLYLPASDLTP